MSITQRARLSRKLPRPQRRRAIPLAVLAAVALLWVAVAAAPARAATWGARVYFTEQEVLQTAFTHGEKVVEVNLDKAVTPERRFELGKEFGSMIVVAYTRCFQASLNGKVVAYAFIDNVVPRERPLTYLLKVNHPSGEVAQYEVMVYREPIGDIVRNGPFREQFYGKTLHDPMVYGKDLRMMSGATLSANGLRDGIRRLLFLYDRILKDLPLQPGAPIDLKG